MSTCPRCGANHIRKLDPRGRPGGDADCTTWWCPRGHKWRELGRRVGPERALSREALIPPGSAVEKRTDAWWMAVAGRIYLGGDGATPGAIHAVATVTADPIRWDAVCRPLCGIDHDAATRAPCCNCMARVGHAEVFLCGLGAEGPGRPHCAHPPAQPEPPVATLASPGAIRHAGPIKARNAAQAPTEQPCLSAADIAEGGGCYGCLSCTNAGLDEVRVCFCWRGAAGPGQAGCERKQPVAPAKPPPLPRPERVEPWQVWSGAGRVGLIVECWPGSDVVAYMDGRRVEDNQFAPADPRVDFLGWFKPRSESGEGRGWLKRGYPAGTAWITKGDWCGVDRCQLYNRDNGDWLPGCDPTEADIAEWRETWGRA